MEPAEDDRCRVPPRRYRARSPLPPESLPTPICKTRSATWASSAFSETSPTSQLRAMSSSLSSLPVVNPSCNDWFNAPADLKTITIFSGRRSAAHPLVRTGFTSAFTLLPGFRSCDRLIDRPPSRAPVPPPRSQASPKTAGTALVCADSRAIMKRSANTLSGWLGEP